jgi:hypothetical protein
MGEKTLKTADGHDKNSKHQRFHKAAGDIFHLGGGNDPIKVGPGVDTQQYAAADPSADDTDEIKKGG